MTGASAKNARRRYGATGAAACVKTEHQSPSFQCGKGIETTRKMAPSPATHANWIGACAKQLEEQTKNWKRSRREKALADVCPCDSHGNRVASCSGNGKRREKQANAQAAKLQRTKQQRKAQKGYGSSEPRQRGAKSVGKAKNVFVPVLRRRSRKPGDDRASGPLDGVWQAVLREGRECKRSNVRTSAQNARRWYGRSVHSEGSKVGVTHLQGRHARVRSGRARQRRQRRRCMFAHFAKTRSQAG